MRVEEVMALLTKRFTQKFFVQPCNIGILVTDTNLFSLIDFIQGLHSGTSRINVGADRLSSAVNASTGAGHDLYKVKILSAGPNFLQ
ncbi:MAG: hypothetical protein H6Q07_3533 [Acidobacteria bacterium]|nr:hypothetical protein [Acidobacteriota bacterium]